MSFDSTSMFEDNRPDRRVKGRQCPVITVFGTEGGVGTSTISLMLAEIAANEGQVPRVALFDARIGRSDLRSWLRISDRAPSFETALISNQPMAALIESKRLNGFRTGKVNDVSFGAAFTPPISMENTTEPRLVMEAIDAARYVVDLVIVDVGPIDMLNNSSFMRIGTELMRIGSWGVIVATLSKTSVDVLATTLNELTSELNINRDRLHVMFNRRDAKYKDQHIAALKANLVSPMAHFEGCVDEDRKGVFEPMTTGQIPMKHRTMAPMCASVLHQVTGRSTFEPLALASNVDEQFLVDVEVDYDNQDRYESDAKKRKKGPLPWSRGGK